MEKIINIFLIYYLSLNRFFHTLFLILIVFLTAMVSQMMSNDVVFGVFNRICAIEVHSDD